MKGLNLSKFKKVSQDQDSAMMLHPDGHQIKIAMKGLSPQMRKEMAAMPLHKAEGGPVSANSSNQQASMKENYSSNSMAKKKKEETKKTWALMDKYHPKKMADGGEVNEEFDEPSVPAMADGGKVADKKAPEYETGKGMSGEWHVVNKHGQIHSSWPKLEDARRTASDLINKKPRMMADGGDPKEEDKAPEAKPAAPVVINVGGQGAQSPQPEPSPTPSGQQPQAPLPPPAIAPEQQLSGAEQTPEQAAQQAASQQQKPTPQAGAPEPMDEDSPEPAQNSAAPAPKAAAPQAPAQPPAPKLTPAQQASHDTLMSTMQLAQDLANQKITPKTYGDMLGFKDVKDAQGNVVSHGSTLKGIANIFAMLAAGAGSGLAHQQNSVMQMWNKAIERDVEAQKQQASNYQNIYHLTSQELDARANRGLTGINSDAMKQKMAILNTKMVTFHKMAQDAKNETDPVARANKEKALALAYNSLQGDIADAADASAGATALQGFVPTEAHNVGPVNLARVAQLNRAAQMKIPGAPTGEDLSNIQSEATKLTQTKAIRDTWKTNFDDLHKKLLNGILDPHQRKASVDDTAAQIATVTGGGIEQAQQRAEDMLPQKGDGPGTAKLKTEKAEQFFKTLSAATPTLNRFNLRTDEESAPSKGGAASSKNSNEIKRLNPDTGNTIVYDAKTKKPLRIEKKK